MERLERENGSGNVALSSGKLDKKNSFVLLLEWYLYSDLELVLVVFGQSWLILMVKIRKGE